MGLFNKQPPAVAVPEDGQEALGRRIRQLENELELIKGSLEKLRFEWQDTLDRMTRLVARINARARWDDQTPTTPTDTAERERPEQFDHLEAQRALRARRGR